MLVSAMSEPNCVNAEIMAGHDRTRDTTRHDKTRQDTTRHDKTRDETATCCERFVESVENAEGRTAGLVQVSLMVRRLEQ